MAREMATFMEEENIPEPFCKNIMESCEYQWIRTGGMEVLVILVSKFVTIFVGELLAKCFTCF